MPVAHTIDLRVLAPHNPTMSLGLSMWAGVTLVASLGGFSGIYDDQAWTNALYSTGRERVFLHNVFIGTGANSNYVSTIYGNAEWSIDPRRRQLVLEKLANWAGSPHSATASNAVDPTPLPRHVYGMYVEIPDVDEIHLFNGANGPAGHPNDHWAYHVTSRTYTLQQSAGQTPFAVMHEGAAAWSSGRQRIVYYLGENNETWLYDRAANAWSQLSSGGDPGQLMGARAQYIPDIGAVVLFGGGTYPNGGNRFWALFDSASQWVDISTGTLPSSRRHMAFSYDTIAKRALIAGGEAVENGTALTDTWAWNPVTRLCTQLTVTGSYGAPGQSTAAFHARENLHVFHGANSWYLIRPDWTGT